MMRVVEGTPFTVPDGKVLVVTGVASTGTGDSSKDLFVRFDGTVVLAAKTMWQAGSGARAGAGPATPRIPAGLVAQEGVMITVQDPASELGVLLGYLADA